MSLQVWLPLTKDLRNQGLSNVTVTNNGATFNSVGKLGGSYSFNGSSRIEAALPTSVSSSIGSLACWVKFDSLPSSSTWFNLIQLGAAGGFAASRLSLYYEYGTGINISIDGSATGRNYIAYTFATNIWYHIVCTYDGTTVKVYINGNQILSKTATKGSYTTAATKIYFGGPTNFYLKGAMNDARYYDHCLSPLEVKKISQGLVLHYRLSGIGGENLLNNNFTQMSKWTDHGLNSATVTTEGYKNTFTLIKGISGWESFYSKNTITLSAGTYTLSCQYKVYSDYTPYSGTFGLALTTSVPTGNDNSVTIAKIDFPSTATNTKLGSITFTLSQNTSVYIGINAGHIADGAVNKVFDIDYIKLELGSHSTPWCPNSSDTLYSIMGLDDNIEYDCSGFGNNGTKNNIVWSGDTPRYVGSYEFNGTNSYIKTTDNNWISQYAEEMTINVWAYADDWATQTKVHLFSCTENGGFNVEGGASGYLRFSRHVATNAGHTTHTYQYNNNGIKLADLNSGWHMFTFVYNTSGEKIYVDGQLHSEGSYTSYGLHFNTGARLFLGCEASGANPSSPYFNGKESDFRIYYTALSADDVLNLYHLGGSIDSNGVFHTYEYVEGE